MFKKLRTTSYNSKVRILEEILNNYTFKKAIDLSLTVIEEELKELGGTYSDLINFTV